MHATNFQYRSQLPAQTSAEDRPLAQSVFSGEARLRELEHLAETARKVRDQAAAELTRNGSTHHIARDRIAAAERMLRKTQQEIAELRAQLGPVAPPAPKAPPQPQDFELAVLLGHSKARFNRDGAFQSTLALQQDTPYGAQGLPAALPGSSKHPAYSSVDTVETKTPSSWRTLAFSLLVTLGIGLGALGTYAIINTGSITNAAQIMQEGTNQLVTRLRALIPAIGAYTTGNNTAATFSQLQTRPQDALQIQEQQVRAAAEQRLARQIANLEKHR